MTMPKVSPVPAAEALPDLPGFVVEMVRRVAAREDGAPVRQHGNWRVEYAGHIPGRETERAVVVRRMGSFDRLLRVHPGGECEATGEPKPLFPPEVRGDTTLCTISYPRSGHERFVVVTICDVRAASDVRLSYDFDRDGWRIERDDRGPEGEGGWAEVAFVAAWPDKPEAP
jgi:hypothetical protein